MADMIQSLDKIVEPGSELWLFNSVPVVERVDMLLDKGNKMPLDLKNLKVKNAYGNPTLRQNILSLKSLDEFGDPTGEELPLIAFESTLILADETAQTNAMSIDRIGVKNIGAMNPSDHHALSTDGRTLATFLLVTDVREEQLLHAAQAAGDTHIKSKKEVKDDGRERIISEILDATNTKSLLAQLECSGYVLSNRIVSDLVAQVAENPEMRDVLQILMRPGGSTFYLQPITDYVMVKKEGPLTFWDVALRASDRDEIAVGYKSVRDTYMAFDQGTAEFTMTNPTDKRKPRTWEEGDMLVTIGKKCPKEIMNSLNGEYPRDVFFKAHLR